MTPMSTNTFDQLQDIFRDVFDDEAIEMKEEMAGDDIEGWDSLGHINLIIAVEQRFGIKFATAEISKLKEKGQNIGSLLRLVDSKRK
jgi:acyl carrier protein